MVCYVWGWVLLVPYPVRFQREPVPLDDGPNRCSPNVRVLAVRPCDWFCPPIMEIPRIDVAESIDVDSGTGQLHCYFRCYCFLVEFSVPVV